MRTPSRAARFDLHGMRQQAVRLAGGPVPAPDLAQAWACRGYLYLCVYPPKLHNRAAHCGVASVEVQKLSDSKSVLVRGQLSCWACLLKQQSYCDKHLLEANICYQHCMVLVAPR